MVGGEMRVDGPWIGVRAFLLVNKGENLMGHGSAGVVIGSLESDHRVKWLDRRNAL
jgi:hypothetical protein